MKKVITPKEILEMNNKPVQVGVVKKGKVVPTRGMGIIRQLTPELAYKMWEDAEKRAHEKEIAKKHVLHHLKQLKAQTGKLKKGYGNKYNMAAYRKALEDVYNIINKKIEKIKSH